MKVSPLLLNIAKSHDQVQGCHTTATECLARHDRGDLTAEPSVSGLGNSGLSTTMFWGSSQAQNEGGIAESDNATKHQQAASST
jgi:hypothetical protein